MRNDDGGTSKTLYSGVINAALPSCQWALCEQCCRLKVSHLEHHRSKCTIFFCSASSSVIRCVRAFMPPGTTSQVMMLDAISQNLFLLRSFRHVDYSSTCCSHLGMLTINHFGAIFEVCLRLIVLVRVLQAGRLTCYFAQLDEQECGDTFTIFLGVDIMEFWRAFVQQNAA